MTNCITISPVPVCFTAADGTKTSLLEHVIYENGVAIGNAFTTPDDVETIFDISGGTIAAGACPVAPPDVEWVQLCDDVNGDGSEIVPFMCRTITTFDANCNVIEPVLVANFELDKVTPYTPQGTVGLCDQCEVVGSLGTITAWADISA